MKNNFIIPLIVLQILAAAAPAWATKVATWDIMGYPKWGGYAGGGLDDRFDFILVSQALLDGKALDYSKGSYLVYGNDGKHFNKSINDTPYSYPKAVMDALYLASDHLPVLVSLKAY